MEPIYSDFSSLHLIEGALPIWTDKKGDVRMAGCWGVWAHTSQALNFVTITVLRLNQFISSNACPRRWLGNPHSSAQINRLPFVSSPDTTVMYRPNKINIPGIYSLVPRGVFQCYSETTQGRFSSSMLSESRHTTFWTPTLHSVLIAALHWQAFTAHRQGSPFLHLNYEWTNS